MWCHLAHEDSNFLLNINTHSYRHVWWSYKYACWFWNDIFNWVWSEICCCKNFIDSGNGWQDSYKWHKLGWNFLSIDAHILSCLSLPYHTFCNPNCSWDSFATLFLHAYYTWRKTYVMLIISFSFCFKFWVILVLILCLVDFFNSWEAS